MLSHRRSASTRCTEWSIPLLSRKGYVVLCYVHCFVLALRRLCLLPLQTPAPLHANQESVEKGQVGRLLCHVQEKGQGRRRRD